MSAGLALPRQVFGHGLVLMRGEKMSKSLGTVLDPLEAADRLGPDPLRLYLTKEIVFGSDGDFTWDRFEEKYNVDLANNLGNLVSRVTAMTERYRGGQLRATAPNPRVADIAVEAVRTYRAAMDVLALDRGCWQAFKVIDATNEFIAASEPWVLAKEEDHAGLDVVLWTAAEALRVAAVLLGPVMPASCEEILRRVGSRVSRLQDLRLDRDAAFVSSGEAIVQRKDALWPRLEAPRTISVEGSPVTDSSKPDAPAAAAATPALQPAAPADARISIDEFMKIDLRVAKVIAAERVPNSKRLMKLSVDLGTEQRTVVAGIAEAYEADALVGRHVRSSRT